MIIYKTTVKLLACGLILIFANANAQKTNSEIPNDYKLVWADEFNNLGSPDPELWSFEQGFVRNEELQWYQKGNTSIKNGLLTIEARREQVKNVQYKANSNRGARR